MLFGYFVKISMKRSQSTQPDENIAKNNHKSNPNMISEQENMANMFR